MHHPLPSIVLENVNFFSHEKHILKSITQTIKANEKILLLGPNGCGKSTLLKVIAGILHAEGKIQIFGTKAYVHDAKRKRIFIPQEIDFPSMLKIKEITRFVQSHYLQKIRTKDLLKRFELNGNDDVSRLSTGQKKRLALALAMLARPQLLILDEPDSGLDMFFRESILKDIINVNQDPMSILMTTHFLDEMKISYFDRIILMKNGGIEYADSISSFLCLKETLLSWDICTEKKEFIDTFIKPYFRHAHLNHNTLRFYAKRNDPVLNQIGSFHFDKMRRNFVTLEDLYLYYIGA